MPALNIPIKATGLDDFKRDMTSTSTLVGAATRTITRSVIEMNAGFLASQGSAGAATLAFGRMLPVVGQVILAYKAVKGAIDLMSYATDLAKVKIAEFNDIAAKANASGVGSDFFQRFTKGGASAALSIDQVTELLKQFKDASTNKLGGSDIQQSIDRLAAPGVDNFKGNTGTAALASANTTEEKLRAVVSLIDQAMQKGERLAALDIAGKAFGQPVQAALQADSGYLDQMLKRADAMSNAKIISPEDVGRAIELKERMDAAQETLANKWKPIQDDLAKLGMNYHAAWVSITEDLASAVGYATDLYVALGKVPDWFAKRIGGASIWTSLTNATTTPESRAASEASLGISSDPKEVGMVTANAKLTAALQNHANVARGMQQATDVQSAVRGDTSKDPAKQGSKDDANDAVDRATNALRRHVEQTEANTKAVGLGDAALARFRAEAQETAAVQANSGKETAEQAAQFKTLQDRAAAAADALAKARVNSDIKFNAATALLPPDEVAIARQLASVYGSDVPKALASSEAAQIRFNNAMKGTGDAFSTSINGPLLDYETGVKSAGDATKDFEQQFIRSLLNMANQMLIIKPIASGLQSLLGGFSLTSLFGGSALPMPGDANFIGPVQPHADGGMISGPGGPRDDRIPAMLSNGEYVVNAAATSKNRALLESINAGVPRFANGGFVGGGSSAVPMVGGMSIVAPQIAVTVQGSPGMSNTDHQKMGENIGKAAMAHVKEMISKELFNQRRPGGLLQGSR